MDTLELELPTEIGETLTWIVTSNDVSLNNVQNHFQQHVGYK